MNTFTIADAFSHGWTKTKGKFLQVSLVLICYALISVSLSRVSEMSQDFVFWNVVVFAITLAIGVALRIGITRYFLNAEEGNSKFRDLFNTDGVYFTYFVGYISLIVITIVGLVLFIIPGIIAAVVYFFVPILIVDRKLDVIEAFKESALITKGHRLHLLAFLAISLLLNFIGVLVLVVGLLVTVPMTFFAGIYIYKRLIGAELPVIQPDENNQPLI